MPVLCWTPGTPGCLVDFLGALTSHTSVLGHSQWHLHRLSPVLCAAVVDARRTGSLRGMTHSPGKGNLRSCPWGWVGRTVQIGILDVDGLGGLVVSGAVRVVGWGHEHLQHPFGEARLEHHAAAPHAHVLAARVQVVDAHGDCRPERTQVRPRAGSVRACSPPSPGPCVVLFQYTLCPHPTPASGWVVCMPPTCAVQQGSQGCCPDLVCSTCHLPFPRCPGPREAGPQHCSSQTYLPFAFCPGQPMGGKGEAGRREAEALLSSSLPDASPIPVVSLTRDPPSAALSPELQLFQNMIFSSCLSAPGEVMTSLC